MNKQWHLMFGIFVVLAGFSSAHANTTALGLTLGQTTLNQFTKAWPSAQHEGRSKWSEGDIYSIPTNELVLEGIKSNAVIFNKAGRVTAVVIDIDKNKFDQMHQMLSQKYTVRKHNVSVVGDKYARYENDNDVIELDAPHLSAEMTLTYSEKMFQEAYLKKSAEQLDKR
ncbi:MAG: hypothetical protein WAK61_08940 [Leclercia sp.]